MICCLFLCLFCSRVRSAFHIVVCSSSQIALWRYCRARHFQFDLVSRPTRCGPGCTGPTGGGWGGHAFPPRPGRSWGVRLGLGLGLGLPCPLRCPPPPLRPPPSAPPPTPRTAGGAALGGTGRPPIVCLPAGRLSMLLLCGVLRCGLLVQGGGETVIQLSAWRRDSSHETEHECQLSDDRYHQGCVTFAAGGEYAVRIFCACFAYFTHVSHILRMFRIFCTCFTYFAHVSHILRMFQIFCACFAYFAHISLFFWPNHILGK